MIPTWFRQLGLSYGSEGTGVILELGLNRVSSQTVVMIPFGLQVHVAWKGPQPVGNPVLSLYLKWKFPQKNSATSNTRISPKQRTGGSEELYGLC